MKEILKKIDKNKQTICVVGLGYVGLPLCLRMIKRKINVFGVDNDIKKIKCLKNGKSYISDIKDSELKYFKNNKSKISTNYNIIKECDVVIVCLPTPLHGNKPDMSYLENSYKAISKVLSKNKVIILESTVYPGATNQLTKYFSKKLKIGKDIFIGYSPERENPGDTNFSYDRTPKIVSGITEKCKILVKNIYKNFINKVILVDTVEIAEMSKLLENTYRSVNISLVNELKIICERLEIDVHNVIEAASTKNFGYQKFVPGPGIGGHCIPIDPFYLSWISKKNGYDPKFIRAAGEISSFVPKWIVKKITNFFNNKNLKLAKVLIIGISYKPNVGDDRESPAFDIMKFFSKKKIKYDFYDPYFNKLRIGRKNQISLKRITLNQNNLKKYDASIIITDHDKVDYDLIFKNSKFIFDCRARYKKIKRYSEDKKIIYC